MEKTEAFCDAFVFHMKFYNWSTKNVKLYDNKNKKCGKICFITLICV